MVNSDKEDPKAGFRLALRRCRIAGVLAGIGVCLVTACGPSLTSSPSGVPGQESMPKHGGVLNTAINSDPNDWDMRGQGTTGVNVEMHGLVYETLLRFKKGADVEYTSQAAETQLAERWEISPDAQTFTFTLRKDARFQNVPPVNGRPLTAADVKWSMEYYSAKELMGKKLPTSQVEFMYEGLDRIDTPDPYTVIVRFRDPYGPFIYYAASQWMPISAREVYEQDGHLKDRLIGSGPFLFDDQATQKGTIWVVKKDGNHRNQDSVYLDSIRRLVLPEVATQQAAFQARQLDTINVNRHTSAQELAKGNPQAGSEKYLVPIGNALLTSQRRGGPLADVRVRRAVSLAIDREEHNRVLFGGEGAPYVAGSWPGVFPPAEVKEMTRYDPEEAKRLLAQAGHPNPSFEMIVTTTDDTTQHQLVQSQLKRVGIDLRFTVLPREQHRPRLFSGDYDFYRNSGGGLLEADPDSSLFGEFHSQSSLNWSQIRDPELDRLLLVTRRETDPQRRQEAIRTALKRVHEMAWDPGIVHPANWAFWHPYVKNWRPHFSKGEKEAVVWLDK